MKYSLNLIFLVLISSILAKDSSEIPHFTISINLDLKQTNYQDFQWSYVEPGSEKNAFDQVMIL